MVTKTSAEAARWLTQIIRDYVNLSPENNLQNDPPEKAFSDPLVGFSNGADPLWEDYKEHVGPFHLMPMDIFKDAFPSVSASSVDLTVISWTLPQTEATRTDNRKESEWPAERWARARIFGEIFNNKLRTHLVAELTAAGIEAVAAMHSPLWSTQTSETYGFASTWSERHAAYASGLGTFGLCDGLITPKGKAMRTGSVIANIMVDPTPRPYTDHHEYCLFYTEGICGKCIPRCPVNALSKEGHDKITCRAYLKPETADYVKTNFGFEGYGCGLCQTGVPCESKIPTADDL
jgi:epoxyqueuosine reductase QueG